MPDVPVDEPQTGRVEGGCRDDYQRGGFDPGDRHFLEFWRGVGPGGRILYPNMMTVIDPGWRISCSLGSRLSLTWSR